MELSEHSSSSAVTQLTQRALPRARPSSFAMLALANLLWSGQGVAIKLLSSELQPLAIALLPFCALAPAGCVFLVVVSPEKNLWRRAWRARYPFLLAGIGGQLLAQTGMTLGISQSLASNGAILSMLIPVLSALLAVQLLGERLTRLRIASLLLGAGGALLLSWPFPRTAVASSLAIGPHGLLGNLLIALGCLGSAFYNVYSKSLLEHFSELEILIFSYLPAAVCGTPLLAIFSPRCIADLARLSPHAWLTLGFLTIGLYGLSMVLFLRALRSVEAVSASMSLWLVPFFGVVFGVLVLHEHLGLQAILGSILVLVSALVLFRFDLPASTQLGR